MHEKKKLKLPHTVQDKILQNLQTLLLQNSK